MSCSIRNTIFMSNEVTMSEEIPKADEPKKEDDFDFEVIKQKNENRKKQLARERNQHNKGVVRSHGLKR